MTTRFGILLVLAATTTARADTAKARDERLAMVGSIRPELHRYCARFTGSVIDGEDIVQDALAKAYIAADAELMELQALGICYLPGPMTKTTKTAATPDLDPATIAHLKLVANERKRAARALLKRRRKKSHQ